MIYTQLIRFLLPLVLTMMVQEIGVQVLNGGMARVPRATETLASFGLAWGLVSFVASPMMQTKQLGLVLVRGRNSYRKVHLFVLLAGLLLAGILAILVVQPLSGWAIEGLHGVDPSLGDPARTMLFWLIPIPLLQGLALFYAGVLLRVRRTDLVSYGMLANMAASILAVFVLLPVGFVQDRPIWLPILVTYAGASAELAVVLWGHRRHAGHLWVKEEEHPLTFRYVLDFFWPLGLIMAIQGFSRPLINLFVSREAGGAEALAVLTIVNALAHLLYGWLNELRNLPSAFQDEENSLQQIRRFALGCGLASFGLMVVAYWTPLRVTILDRLMGLSPELTAHSAAPLIVFSFFPLVVMARAYLHGVGLLEHRTQAMAPSAPLRILAILAALVILPVLGVHGATRGVAALLAGFVVETIVVWWGIRGRAYRRRRASELAGPVH